jgi:hypothetical protein
MLLVLGYWLRRELLLCYLKDFVVYKGVVVIVFLNNFVMLVTLFLLSVESGCVLILLGM